MDIERVTPKRHRFSDFDYDNDNEKDKDKDKDCVRCSTCFGLVPKKMRLLGLMKEKNSPHSKAKPGATKQRTMLRTSSPS